jgi:hypothetical protein
VIVSDFLAGWTTVSCVMQSLIIALGESDCESLGRGFLAQPVNALSSLAFSVLGAVVLVSVTKWRGRERANRVVFGVLMVATGVGSFMFHGPQGSVSHFLHDVTFILAIVSLALMNLGAVLAWSERRGFATLAAVGIVVSTLLVVWPSNTNVIAGFAVLTLVVVDVALFRSAFSRNRWWIASTVTMALAVLFFVLGRTGGPICDSDSLFQGHALWHGLSGVALWLYFEATTSARTGTGR